MVNPTQVFVLPTEVLELTWRVTGFFSTLVVTCLGEIQMWLHKVLVLVCCCVFAFGAIACSDAESPDSEDSSASLEETGNSDLPTQSEETLNSDLLTQPEGCALVDAWHIPGYACSGAFSCTVESEDCYCAAPFEGPVACSPDLLESTCSCSDGIMACDIAPHAPFNWEVECVEPGPEACEEDTPCETGACFMGRCHTSVPIGVGCDDDFEWSPCVGEPFFCEDNICVTHCETTEDCAVFEEQEAAGNIPAGTFVCDTNNRCSLVP